MRRNGHSVDTPSDEPARLSAGECLRLMASVPVGRIVYTRQALPAVELVPFALDLGSIVVRTEQGSRLADVTRAAVVAFEADHVDADRRSGWRVTAVGRSREVTDPGEVARLRGIGLPAWAPGAGEHFIRITPGILNGWRLRYAPPRGRKRRQMIAAANDANS